MNQQRNQSKVQNIKKWEPELLCSYWGGQLGGAGKFMFPNINQGCSIGHKAHLLGVSECYFLNIYPSPKKFYTYAYTYICK